MSNIRKLPRAKAPAFDPYDFRVELSRGSSHIASTLTVTTRLNAVSEVISEFTGRYGKDLTARFCEMLIEALRNRKSTDGAQAVSDFALTLDVAAVKRGATRKILRQA